MFMHVKAKRMAFGGLLLALTVICMVLGSVIETNTLFLLAAASYFVGIVVRENGLTGGVAFYLAGILLGLLVAPNKLYVASYGAMGLYILGIEWSWRLLGRTPEKTNRRVWFWVIKYVIFNIMFIPMVIFFPKLLIARTLPVQMLFGIIGAGQIALILYDKAYEYVQGHIWSKMRGRFL